MKKILIFFTTIAFMLMMVACSQAQETQMSCSAIPDTETETYIILDDFFEENDYAIAMRKGDYALNRELQKHMDAMIADGTFSQLSNKWFGKDVSLPEADFVEEYEATEGDTSLQDVLDKGYLSIGVQTLFPPMTFEDENNEIVGFDIDLAKEVTKRMGIDYKPIPIKWAEKENELNSGNIDVIWTGTSITKPRMETMYFSKPYMKNKEIIVVPEGSDIVDRKTLEGKTVGVLRASSGLNAIESDEETFSRIDSIIEYSNLIRAYSALKEGRIDALVGDDIALRRLIESDTIEWKP